MPSCWSCLVMIEQGVTVCPFCGADQTRPVEIVDPNLPPPVTLKSTLRDWRTEIMLLLVTVGLVTGIFWHNFREESINPALQAAAVTADSLRELREALSAYALRTKNVYPVNMDSLGGRTSQSIQSAQGAGYTLQYLPNPSPNDAAPRGFVILARPEKSEYPSLYIDETGVVRATEEGRQATVRDPPL